jgi:hypothetical protein
MPFLKDINRVNSLDFDMFNGSGRGFFWGASSCFIRSFDLVSRNGDGKAIFFSCDHYFNGNFQGRSK